VAVKSDEHQAAERKAEAFAQELDRVRVELRKLRQQHDALQGVIKSQDKTPAERRPVIMPTEESVLSTFLRTAAVVIVVIVCSVAAFQVGARRGKAAGVQAGLEMAQVTPVQPPERPSKETPPPVEPPKRIAWPKISVAGVKVTAGDRECAMVFESAVFSSRAVIAPEAAEALQSIAVQVRGSLTNLSLVIEGHTDTTPVSSAAGNNYKLGLARANAVLEFLKSKGDLPAASMTATSKGEDDPPYSNDDETSRRKNRTVVLKLVSKDRK
jgi:flagellar motor protein MotB